MKSKLLKILLTVVFVIILAVVYLRSGEIYYENVGFGGPSLKLRLGSFSYQNWSYVGELDHAIGFVNPFNSKIELNPISFLSSDKPFFLIFNKSFVRIKCGERNYLILEEEKDRFFKWTTESELAGSTSNMMQPYFILEGDENKRFGKCSIQN